MLHREPGCWWWVLVVMVAMMMMTGVMETGAQKIDMDGLDEDKYNMRKPESEDKKDSKKLKYVVTEEVYLDILIDNSKESEAFKGRITIACFGEITPITCLNFVALAKGHRMGKKMLHYKGTPIHRVVRDFVVQMGDVTGKKGKSGFSIYGESFNDENFQLSHRGAGWVSMANHGRNTNGSQFFLMLQPARWLDGKHVAFGKVIKGMDIVRKLGEVPTSPTGKPRGTVQIEDSGVVGIRAKYDLSEKDVMSTDDIAK